MPLAGTPVEKVDVSIQYNDYVLQALNSENLLLRERVEGHEKNISPHRILYHGK